MNLAHCVQLRRKPSSHINSALGPTNRGGGGGFIDTGSGGYGDIGGYMFLAYIDCKPVNTSKGKSLFMYSFLCVCVTVEFMSTIEMDQS